MAKVFALAIPSETFARVVTCGVDLADQRLAPASDRRNVTELWRVRLEREQSELTREGGDHHG